MPMEEKNITNKHVYKIGAVSKMTGLPQETIRTWERRYGLLTPQRTDSGLRLYHEADIAKLQLIRCLSQKNQAVAHLAKLSTDELKQRLAESTKIGQTDPITNESTIPQLGIVGRKIHHQIQIANTMSELSWDVAFSFKTTSDLPSNLQESVDILLLELADLGTKPLDQIERLKSDTSAKEVIVLFDYISLRQSEELGKHGIQLVRFTPKLPELERYFKHRYAIPKSERTKKVSAINTETRLSDIPPRKFTDEQLAWLREVSTSVECECPKHLSGIATALVAFEDYSRKCQSEDLEGKALHQELERTTANARTIIEDLIVRICQYEGLSLPSKG